MLLQLTINDYAVARALDAEFHAGMTAITGETGAGKSILLDALGLALGDRADADAIATDADRADISALFDVKDIAAASSWLDTHGFPAEEQQCLLRRVILREGRSRAWINGQPATLQQLRELGDLLIDIHSQHEHQSLLKKETHRRLLDAFGQHDDDISALQQVYRQWRDVQQQIEHLQGAREDLGARLQLLQYQVEELDKAAPQPDELLALETEQKQLANAGELINHCEQLLDICSDNEHYNLQQALVHAQQLLSRSTLAESMPQLQEMLNGALIQIEEAAQDLQRYRSHITIDPERLAEVEQRLDTLFDLARKHRVHARDLPALHETLHGELKILLDSDGAIAQLQQQQTALEKQYQKIAKLLTDKRKQAATILIEQVNQQLILLKMAHCCFAIGLQKNESTAPHLYGAESIEFLISTQPDTPARALARVASGGELSRISLAIQVVTANTSRTPTLVFDEVDVGIGGATAIVVGQLLRQLGERGQVLCVTHQAQVAAQAHQHLQVSKSLQGKRMETALHTLDNEQRIDEIARMIGGEHLTPQSRAHAGEMLGFDRSVPFDSAQEADQPPAGRSRSRKVRS
ncbi:MAG TPA: DNA repair protein RecN [Pseudomonadales bacterium]|nr:DNA repair protein RecN [Pseudomonadales bacterium]